LKPYLLLAKRETATDWHGAPLQHASAPENCILRRLHQSQVPWRPHSFPTLSFNPPESDLTSSQIRYIFTSMTRTKQAHNEPSARTLGETIRDLRKANGLTQGYLAKEVGVDESYISKIETGRLNYTPSEETLRLMAKILGADALALLSLAQRAPHELRDVVDSQPAREFFKIVGEQQINTEDWHELTRRLRSRISKRQGGR